MKSLWKEHCLCMRFVGTHVHTDPILKGQLFGVASWFCVPLCWIPTGPRVQVMPAWCRPGAALIYQIKPCVRRQSPASFCSLHLGHNQDLAASPLSSLCDLASFAVSGAAWVCLVAQASRCHPCVLSRFGQMHWLNMIENLVDLPF